MAVLASLFYLVSLPRLEPCWTSCHCQTHHAFAQMSETFLPFQPTLLSHYTCVVHHRRGLVWTESWMSRSNQLPVVLKRVVSFPWLFWKWRHRLFIGAQWYQITENKKIWAQLERDRGRQYRGNRCLGLRLVRIPDIKLVRPWWGSLGPLLSWDFTSFLIFWLWRLQNKCPRCCEP